MLKTILKRFLWGIVFGCVAFTFAVLAASFISGSTTAFIGQGAPGDLMKTAGAMMLVSTGFSMSALIYETKRLGLGLQVLLHMVIGTIIFCLVAYFAGWIPVGGALYYILLAVLFAVGIWAITYILMKRMARRINQKLKENQSTR